MSVYGSYPPSSGYDYSAPAPVVIPALPYENNQYQLPDTHQQGPTTAINRHYQQDVYYTDKVIVKDHVVLCCCGHDTGKRYRTFEYVPPTMQLGAVRSWTEGQEPPMPVVSIDPYGNPSNGYNTAPPAMPSYPAASFQANTYPNAPQQGAQPVWPTFQDVFTSGQEWTSGQSAPSSFS